MDRVTVSYPGTPTKVNGYLQHSQFINPTTGYGRPSSINLHHPSIRYSPDPSFHHGTWSLGSHRQTPSSTYSDRHYPISSSSSLSYNPYLTSGVNQRETVRSTSPSILARRNISLPIHSSSSLIPRSSIMPTSLINHYRRSPEPYTNKGTSVPTGTSSRDASLREQIKSGLKYFADERKRLHYESLFNQYIHHHHSENDLSYLNQTSSSIFPNYQHVPGMAGSSSSGHFPAYYSQSPRTRQHRSESDLQALFDLYSCPPDPVVERRPQPGVPRVGGIPLMDLSPVMNTSSNYLQRNASYPSIPLPSAGPNYTQPWNAPTHPQAYVQNYHESYQQPFPPYSRYFRSNPNTAYPNYGSPATANSRYNRLEDRYYH